MSAADASRQVIEEIGKANKQGWTPRVIREMQIETVLFFLLHPLFFPFFSTQLVKGLSNIYPQCG